MLFRQLPGGRKIHGEIGRTVGEGNAFLDAGPGVDLRVGDIGIALRQAGLEGLHRLVDFARGQIDLGRAAPHRHRAAALAMLDEFSNVIADLLDHLRLALAHLDVSTVEAANVLWVEDSLHRFDPLELLPDRFQVRRIQHLRVDRRLVGIVGKNVPASELDLLQGREGKKFFQLRRPGIGPQAQPQGPHLRQGTDQQAHLPPRQKYSSDGGGGNCAQPRQQNPQLSFGRANALWFVQCTPP